MAIPTTFRQPRSQARVPMIVLAVAALVAAMLVPSTAGAYQQSGSTGSTGSPQAGIVYAPDTPTEYIDQFSDTPASAGGPEFARPNNHWDVTQTAMNNGGSNFGDSLELTWSILPDGTSMPGFAGEATCNSTLIADLNAVYGAGNWQAEMELVWADWSATTGNIYTPAVTPDANGTPIDDGASWPFSAGVAGVRGDVRIGGCSIDGNSGILAYNFFPSNGDMKIDSSDSFYASNAIDPWFHNVFSHEHGHGAGLSHVCPTDNTKLMEPFINGGFLGLQHDDIRGVQRLHGDRNELINNPNDSSAAATPINPAAGYGEIDLSLDATNDEDWFSFSGSSGDTLDAGVDPFGFPYLEGPQSGGCTAGTTLDSSSIQDLTLELHDSSGLLQSVDANGFGAGESISISLPATGTYFLRVTGAGTDDTQIYDMYADLTPGSTVTCNGLTATIVGTAGDDVITGTDGPDVIAGLAGNDTIDGLRGDDVICGGDGDDELIGSFDDDHLIGEAGNDTLSGDKHDDILDGGEGNDRLIGRGGRDLLLGGPGNDSLIAGGGKDTMYGGDGNDRLVAGIGFDRMYGDAGDDELIGEQGNDVMRGGDGDDTLFGGDGDDKLFGDADTDLCDGGAGANTFSASCESVV